MRAWERYFDTIDTVVDDVRKTQGENIMKAAEICAEASIKGGIIYAFGCWHSLLVAAENFYRAASPANFAALAVQSINGTIELSNEGNLEACYGIGNSIVDYHRLDSNKDVLICISNSGNNIVTVDAALRAKEKGIPVISITSIDYGDLMTTKHNSGKKLKDISDVVIDNKCLIGDAAVALEGYKVKAGPVSGIVMNYIMSSLLVQMSELIIEKGHTPEVYYNGHVNAMSEEARAKFDWLSDIDPQEHNGAFVEKYFYRIKSL